MYDCVKLFLFSTWSIKGDRINAWRYETNRV